MRNKFKWEIDPEELWTEVRAPGSSKWGEDNKEERLRLRAGLGAEGFGKDTTTTSASLALLGPVPDPDLGFTKGPGEDSATARSSNEWETRPLRDAQRPQRREWGGATNQMTDTHGQRKGQRSSSDHGLSIVPSSCRGQGRFLEEGIVSRRLGQSGQQRWHGGRERAMDTTGQWLWDWEWEEGFRLQAVGWVMVETRALAGRVTIWKSDANFWTQEPGPNPQHAEPGTRGQGAGLRWEESPW